MFSKRIPILVLLLAIASSAFCNVVITEFRGKVELRSPGGAWRPAEVGMSVALEDTISTGFNSSAVLTMGANSVIVSPLTRMSVDTYLEREESVDTKLYLQVGAVRAQVDDSGIKKQSFSVASPYSTASVRGTDFTFDGLRLTVSRGSVALLIPRVREAARRARGLATDDGAGDGGDGDGGDQQVVVGQGQSMEVDIDFDTGTVSSSVEGPGASFGTDPTSDGGAGRGPSGSENGRPDGPGSGAGPPPQSRGSVTITWEWE